MSRAPLAGTALEVARRRRRSRFELLEYGRDVTSRAGGRTCMFAASTSTAVSVAADAGGQVHTGGVQRCASPWACPVCAPTIGERRATEIDTAASSWLDQGGHLLFVTATLSHRWGDDLAGLLDMLQGAWSRTWRFGTGVTPPWYAGMVRSVEVTHGANGWHPHIHAAVFIEPGWSDCVETIRQEIVDMRLWWGESVHLFGGSTSVQHAHSPGWDVAVVDSTAGLSEYLTKVEGGWGLGLEIARLDLKKSSKGAKPFDLLASAAAGDRQALVLWAEYERATAGRRRVVASPGLMKRCDVEVQDDDDAAVVELESDPVVIANIPANEWRGLLRGGWVTRLMDDVAALATSGALWPWPPEWLIQSP